MLMQLLEVRVQVQSLLQQVILVGETTTSRTTSLLYINTWVKIGETLAQAQGTAAKLHFLPIRGNFTRGIFATAYTAFNGTIDEAYGLYDDYYKNSKFTFVSRSSLALKQVVGTNRCLLHLHLHEGQLLVTSIIDNLIKGASGQAIQNMNIMFGWEETTGLQLKSISF